MRSAGPGLGLREAGEDARGTDTAAAASHDRTVATSSSPSSTAAFDAPATSPRVSAATLLARSVLCRAMLSEGSWDWELDCAVDALSLGQVSQLLTNDELRSNWSRLGLDIDDSVQAFKTCAALCDDPEDEAAHAEAVAAVGKVLQCALQPEDALPEVSAARQKLGMPAFSSLPGDSQR